MKGLLSNAPGGPETLEIGELPDPVAGPGQVVVAVKACAINYPDVLIIEDKYQIRPPRPFAPGGEIAGVVESVGEGVTRVAPGDRVIAMVGHGGLVEKVVVDAARVHALPEGRSFEEGSALLLTYATTIHALLDRGHLKEGQTLLVLGAAGGVGLAAIELGKAFGARVIAAVSSEEKAAACREAGADDTIVYGRAPFDKEQSKALADQFKAAVGPAGADVIYDPVGGALGEECLSCIAWNGRYLVIGFASGPIPNLAANRLLLKGASAVGVFWGAFTAREPQANAENFAQLFGWLASGALKPVVSRRYALADAGQALRDLLDRQVTGKIVLTP